MSFSGNQYPNYADKVITTRGDIIRGDSSGDRARYGIGAANTVLTSDGTDPAWAAHGGVPTTTKGDISGFSTTQARIPVGTNNYSLFADSAQALGLKWAASPTSTLTTTGDLLASSAANVLTRIGAGASGEVLTGNGAGVLPTFQAAGGGGSLELLNSEKLTTPSSNLQFTPSAALTPADYSAILVNAIVEPTNDGVFHKMTLNSETTGYYLDGIRTSAGTSSTQDNNDVESWRIKDETLENEICISSTLIFIPNSSIPTDEYLSMMSQAFSIGRGFTSVGGYLEVVDQNDIDNIYYAPQAGNWETGSTMTVYGVKRT